MWKNEKNSKNKWRVRGDQIKHGMINMALCDLHAKERLIRA